eukprot:CAMPEP_0198128498 /NCGR_PEP_ID=MMETSP1442-20131203/49509_1 /TAXON_ID= /ORGANISM="Craspedostauros australis, Strain CCMP3328" /LENGTH=280 /DNA_ID=CAMNT_0043788677 /DNA_START=42 /DNA_END=884 /DNA_ORIENTATION=-
MAHRSPIHTQQQQQQQQRGMIPLHDGSGLSVRTENGNTSDAFTPSAAFLPAPPDQSPTTSAPPTASAMESQHPAIANNNDNSYGHGHNYNYNHNHNYSFRITPRPTHSAHHADLQLTQEDPFQQQQQHASILRGMPTSPASSPRSLFQAEQELNLHYLRHYQQQQHGQIRAYGQITDSPPRPNLRPRCTNMPPRTQTASSSLPWPNQSSAPTFMHERTGFFVGHGASIDCFMDNDICALPSLPSPHDGMTTAFRAGINERNCVHSMASLPSGVFLPIIED